MKVIYLSLIFKQLNARKINNYFCLLVLNDPHKRAIYDSLGVKGLHTEGWEIALRTKTPQELREEYERLAKEEEEKRLLMRTNPRGNLTVRIDATDLFNRYSDEYDEIYGSLGYVFF